MLNWYHIHIADETIYNMSLIHKHLARALCRSIFVIFTSHFLSESDATAGEFDKSRKITGDLGF